MRLVKLKRRNNAEVYVNPAHVLQIGALRPQSNLPAACWVRFVGERPDEEGADLHVLGTLGEVAAALEGDRR